MKTKSLKLKKNDIISVIAGKDKGKTGKVLKILPERNRAIVENINLMTRHLRPRKSGEKGQKIKTPASINLSNLQLLCPKCNKATRVGYRIFEENNKKKKTRFCKKCKQNI